MRKTILYFTFLSALFLCSACRWSEIKNSFEEMVSGNGTQPSGNYVSKKFAVKPFTAIDCAFPVKVVFHQSDSVSSVELYAPDNVMNMINVYSKGTTLYLSVRKRGIDYGSDTKITIVAPKLNALSLEGVGDFTIDTDLKTDHFSLKLAGVGHVRAKGIYCSQGIDITTSGANGFESEHMTAKGLQLDESGVGDIKLKDTRLQAAAVSLAGASSLEVVGSTRTAQYDIAGSGSVKASEFVADTVSAGVAGVGEIACHATKLLRVDNKGWGKISYKGSPKIEGDRKNVSKL